MTSRLQWFVFFRPPFRRYPLLHPRHCRRRYPHHSRRRYSFILLSQLPIHIGLRGHSLPSKHDLNDVMIHIFTWNVSSFKISTPFPSGAPIFRSSLPLMPEKICLFFKEERCDYTSTYLALLIIRRLRYLWQESAAAAVPTAPPSPMPSPLPSSVFTRFLFSFPRYWLFVFLELKIFVTRFIALDCASLQICLYDRSITS